MIDYTSKVTWRHESYTGDVVTFEFDSTEMNTQEFFMKWVDFMSAIGYNLDKAEMESMWNGEERYDALDKMVQLNQEKVLYDE